jgi:hypothetical protein
MNFYQIQAFVKKLKMKTFKDLEFKKHPNSIDAFDMGVQARLDFDNGFGVSVVKGPHTYGGDRGLYELAVFKDGEIHYDNQVANGDVVGYLREEDVTDAMLVIQKF